MPSEKIYRQILTNGLLSAISGWILERHWSLPLERLDFFSGLWQDIRYWEVPDREITGQQRRSPETLKYYMTDTVTTVENREKRPALVIALLCWSRGQLLAVF